MNRIVSILNQIFAKGFYRLNSGFFLLIGTLTFGFMSDVEHIALAQFFVSSPYVLLIPMGIWVIYAYKILYFNKQQLTRPENQMAFNVAFLSTRNQIGCIGIFFLLQLLPAVLYGVFLLSIAWQLKAYQSFIVILLALNGIWLTGTAIIFAELQKPHREKKINFLKRFIDYQYPKPLIQFYIEWLLRREPLMLAGTKIFTGALIFGVCKLYGAEDYDWRLVTMGTTLCALANLLILFEIRNFEHRHISWIKNLPLSITKRFTWFLIVFIILIIPETTVMIKYFPGHLSFFWLMLNFLHIAGLGALFFGLLHTKASTLENFTKKAFALFIVLIVLILFKVPLAMVCLMSFTGGFLIYRRYYYLFEPGSS